MNDATAHAATQVTVRMPAGTSSSSILDQWVEEARRQGYPALRDGIPRSTTYYRDELLCGLATVNETYLVLAISLDDARAHRIVNRTVYARPLIADEYMFFGAVRASVCLRLTFNSVLMPEEVQELLFWIKDWVGKLRCPDACVPSYLVLSSGVVEMVFSEDLLSKATMSMRLGNLVDACVTGKPRPFWRYLWFAAMRRIQGSAIPPRRVTVTTEYDPED